MTVDVEDWFHILDSPATPKVSRWENLESRLEPNMEKILELFEQKDVKATFFWLGWMAQRHKNLVLKCAKAGHEIASHGFEHVVPCKVGPNIFRRDIIQAKNILEDIISKPVNWLQGARFWNNKRNRLGF